MPSAPTYGLRLEAVRVQDFKSLRDVALTLSPTTTVLVGENNSGKTSLLEALDVAFGRRHARVEDLHTGLMGRAASFVIDLRIVPTKPGADFDDGVVNAVGTAVQLDPGAPYFTIRVTGTVTAEGWDIMLTRKFVKGWAPHRTAAAALTTLPSPPVGRDVLELLHFDVLDARRDIVEQLRNRRTYWGRTASKVEIDPTVKTTLEGSLKQLGDDLTKNSPVLSRVRDDLKDLSDGLSSGKLNVELEALPRSVDDLIRAMDIIITSSSSSPFPVESHGMGTRSLAALLVFRSYVNVIRGKQKPEQQLSVAAFEEPEAHLHPQAQRAVFEILSEIGGQRLVSTHSAHVAATADFDTYRLFRRIGAETQVSCAPTPLPAGWDRTKVRRFVQRENPEVLFAKAVGIVEGQAEGDLFPVFARAWWGDRGADGVGVSIVVTDGAGGSKHVAPFLDAIGIPWVLFADADPAGVDGLKGAGNVLGRVLDGTSKEVVQLPAGMAIEQYLLADGLGAEARRAAAKHPRGDLDKYKTRRHPRYDAPDGEARAQLEFLLDCKGTIGRNFAEEIVMTRGRDKLPERIREFFIRLDAARGP